MISIPPMYFTIYPCIQWSYGPFDFEANRYNRDSQVQKLPQPQVQSQWRCTDYTRNAWDETMKHRLKGKPLPTLMMPACTYIHHQQDKPFWREILRSLAYAVLATAQDGLPGLVCTHARGWQGNQTACREAQTKGRGDRKHCGCCGYSCSNTQGLMLTEYWVRNDSSTPKTGRGESLAERTPGAAKQGITQRFVILMLD